MSKTQSSIRAVIDTRRPAMTFRLGITGAAKLPPAGAPEYARIEQQLKDVLERVHGQLTELRRSERAKAYYDLANPAILRCLSPLGEGADRLFARAALRLAEHATAEIDICLEAAIPFALRDYEATFSTEDAERHAISIAEFERLLAEAHCGVLELDGDRTSDVVRPQSYEAIGRMVVRNADLIIAIWDPSAPAKGRGGTRDTVHYALQAGVPVWLINADGKDEPRLLNDPLDLWRALPSPAGADEARARYIAGTILPRDLPEGEVDQLLDYLNEPLRACHNLWLLHPKLMSRPSRKPGVSRIRSIMAIRPLSILRRPEFDASRTIASNLAQAYQNRYRTSYLLVFAFAAVALISAVAGIARESWERSATFVELCSLILVALLVAKNTGGRWHTRYISYRLIHELTRSARYLHALGWSLPFNRMRRAVGGEAVSWIAWLAAAYARSAPLPSGNIREALPEIRREITDSLLNVQISFHKKRHQNSHHKAMRFEHWGNFLFFVTAFAVFIKLILFIIYDEGVIIKCVSHQCFWQPHKIIDILSFLGAVLPALSAAAFGIRAYEEFEQLSELSEHIGSDLSRSVARIESIDLTLPLTSQILATELLDAASIMLSEVSGWAQIFRMKAVEA